MITELNVEEVERAFGVVLELLANGAQLQTRQARSVGPQPPPSEVGQALYPSRARRGPRGGSMVAHGINRLGDYALYQFRKVDLSQL